MSEFNRLKQSLNILFSDCNLIINLTIIKLRMLFLAV